MAAPEFAQCGGMGMQGGKACATGLTCQTVNACWRCEHWLTSIDDLSTLQEDFQRVKTELDIATNLGMVRQQQVLTTDHNNLTIRIEVLETIDDGD